MKRRRSRRRSRQGNLNRWHVVAVTPCDVQRRLFGCEEGAKVVILISVPQLRKVPVSALLVGHVSKAR